MSYILKSIHNNEYFCHVRKYLVFIFTCKIIKIIMKRTLITLYVVVIYCFFHLCIRKAIQVHTYFLISIGISLTRNFSDATLINILITLRLMILAMSLQNYYFLYLTMQHFIMLMCVRWHNKILRQPFAKAYLSDWSACVIGLVVENDLS